MFAAQSDERHQGVANLRQFGSIFFVGEREFLERTRHVDKIARIDAHLVGSDSCGKGSARIEMNVSHQRQFVALGDELTANHTNVISLTHTLSGEAHKVGTGIGNAAALSHAALSVHGAGGGHRLHTHRIVGAHHQVLDAHRCGFATFIVNHSSPRYRLLSIILKNTSKRRCTQTKVHRHYKQRLPRRNQLVLNLYSSFARSSLALTILPARSALYASTLAATASSAKANI